MRAGADERHPENSPDRSHGLLSSAADQIVAALVLVATFLISVYPMMDPDVWWHLRTGQLIWERGAVPRTDWFLFTDSDREWINLQWGFDLLITAIYTLGGVNLLVFARASLVTTF